MKFKVGDKVDAKSGRRKGGTISDVIVYKMKVIRILVEFPYKEGWKVSGYDEKDLTFSVTPDMIFKELLTKETK